jgi:Alpha/beta hydrolase
VAYPRVEPVTGYAELWRADPDAWRAAALAWRHLAAALGMRATELAAVASALRGAWSGPAADAADRRLAARGVPCEVGAAECLAVDQVLDEFAGRLARAKTALAAAVTDIGHPLVGVDADGRATVTAAGAHDPAALAAAGRTAARIRAALGLADAADAEAAHRLANLAAAAGAGWPMLRPAGGPACGVEPAVVRAWWDGLTDAERRWLVVREPVLVGGLDGVPAAARDRANRIRLYAAGAPSPALSARLAADGAPRAYLLEWDPAGDGRAIVAVGNPDRADHVFSYVPGAGSGLADVPDELGRVDRVVERAAAVAPDRTVAGVLWLDYDAPDRLTDAMRASYAHDGGPALHRFQEGLVASHDRPSPHLTVVGHSYGSLVVGATARDLGLAADEVVFLGSPGVGVDHASQLGLPGDRVWSATAANDPVQRLAPSLAQAARDAAVGTLLPGAAAWLLAQPDADLWHGRNPSDPSFGGRIFASSPSDPLRGHSDYWRSGNPAVDGLARIALGLGLPAAPGP